MPRNDDLRGVGTPPTRISRPATQLTAIFSVGARDDTGLGYRFMFTGIVAGTFPVVAVTRKPGLLSFAVELNAPLAEGLNTGASVSLNGVCMTVTNVTGYRALF